MATLEEETRSAAVLDWQALKYKHPAEFGGGGLVALAARLAFLFAETDLSFTRFPFP